MNSFDITASHHTAALCARGYPFLIPFFAFVIDFRIRPKMKIVNMPSDIFLVFFMKIFSTKERLSVHVNQIPLFFL